MKSSPTSFSVSLALVCLSTAAAAQVPPKSVLVALNTTTTNSSLVSVTSNGTATALSGYGRGVHTSVALDQGDPASVWGIGTWATTGGAPIGHYKLVGLNASTKGKGDGIVGVFGKANRCHVFEDQLLITIGSVVPGVYGRPLTGGTAKLLVPLADAYDITSLGGNVYVTTWSPTAKTSTLHMLDMSFNPPGLNQVTIAPTAGTPPKLFKAIGTMGWPGSALYVVIGASDGKLWFVDPSKTKANAFTVTFGASRGMAEAIMTHPDNTIGLCIATATGLYAQTAYNSGGKPFYTAPSKTPILDISVIGGGSRLFGKGCAGSKGVPAHGHGLHGFPYMGNTRFTLSMSDGPANTNGALVIGLSRTTYGGAPLPIDLTIIGANKCFLNASIDLRLAVQTDNAGKISIPAAIPANASLRGAKLYTQWGIFEVAANNAGLVTSPGLELTIR